MRGILGEREREIGRGIEGEGERYGNSEGDNDKVIEGYMERWRE